MLIFLSIVVLIFASQYKTPSCINLLPIEIHQHSKWFCFLSFCRIQRLLWNLCNNGELWRVSKQFYTFFVFVFCVGLCCLGDEKYSTVIYMTKVVIMIWYSLFKYSTLHIRGQKNIAIYYVSEMIASMFSLLSCEKIHTQQSFHDRIFHVEGFYLLQWPMNA